MNPAALRTKQRVHALAREAGENGVSVAEVASAVGIHRNTARFHLETLARAGALEVRTAAAAGRGRPAKQFVPVDQARDDDSGFRLLTTIFTQGLSDEPDGPARASRIGRTWGAHQTLPDEDAAGMFALMEGCGFDPEWAEESGPGAQLHLRACPFRELVPDYSQIVCALHAGMIEGALDASGAGLGLGRLTPFTGPNTCTATLVRGRP